MLEDVEGKCLELKIFTPIQIEEIRSFFINLSGEDHSYLNFQDFTTFIIQLVGPVQIIDQNVLYEFYKEFDQNGDGNLDWGEYLHELVQFLQKFNYLKTLKALPTQQLKRRYLSLLQIQHLVKPFEKIQQSPQLYQAEQQLLEVEKQVPSIKTIKGCYFLACQDIPVSDSLRIPTMNLINIQSLYQLLLDQKTQATALLQLIQFLTLVVQQRTPTLLNKIRSIFIPQIENLLHVSIVELILLMISGDGQNDESISLLALQYLTLLVYSLSTFNLQTNILKDSLQIVIFHINSENQMIRLQSLLCLSHLIMWKDSFLEEIFSADLAYQTMQIPYIHEDEQLQMYHSFFQSCLAGTSLEKFINLMNNPDYGNISKAWVTQVRTYTETVFGSLTISEQNPLKVQTIINILKLNIHLLSTPNNDQKLWELMLLMLSSSETNMSIQFQTLQNIQKIFTEPIRLDCQNLQIQVYLLTNGLIKCLLQLCLSPETVLREKALRVCFRTIFFKNASLVSRYMDETQSQQIILTWVDQIYNNIKIYPENYVLNKWTIINGLVQISTHNAGVFQILANEDFMFNQFTQLREQLLSCTNVQLVVFSQRSQYYDLWVDYNIWQTLGVFFSSYMKNFQGLLLQFNLSEQVMAVIHTIVPTQKVVEYIQKYFEFILMNMKQFKPLILKKYLKFVDQSILDLIMTMGQFYTFLHENILKIENANFIKYQLASLIDITQNTYEKISSKTQDIDNLLILVGSSSSRKGNIITVYLNSPIEGKQHKLVLTNQTTLLDFEHEIEQGLGTGNPCIYLVVNQNTVPKSFMDQTIIGTSSFEKFKNYALQLTDTAQGGQIIPQEIVAVNLYKLKFQDEFSMKRLFKIIKHGSLYNEMLNIRGNAILWNMDTTTLNFQDERNILQLLVQETALTPYQVENLHDRFLQFLNRRQSEMTSFLIGPQQFLDFLSEMGVPQSVGKNLQRFLSKSGQNSPIDYRDFVCFLASFQQNQSETLISKLVYLAYMDSQEGVFGYSQLEKYLSDMIVISQQHVSEQQINTWTKDLMQQVDQNNDGYISYFEFHKLLKLPEYKSRLLDPLQRMLANFLIIDSRQYYSPNKFFFNSPSQNPFNQQDNFDPQWRRQFFAKTPVRLFYDG